jgi:hypothetical protein
MRSTTAIALAPVIALTVNAACGDDAANRAPLANPDHVIDQFIIILQGPEFPHEIDQSAATAELVSPETARTRILDAGGTIRELEVGSTWSEEIWLIEVPGVFDGVTGSVLGVVDTSSGLVAKSAVVPD